MQLIRQILKNPADSSCMALLFANQTEADILLREELEEAASQHPDRLRLWYTVDRPTDGKKYFLIIFICIYTKKKYKYIFKISA